jgi:hypothetical protein
LTALGSAYSFPSVSQPDATGADETDTGDLTMLIPMSRIETLTAVPVEIIATEPDFAWHIFRRERDGKFFARPFLPEENGYPEWDDLVSYYATVELCRKSIGC